MLKTADKITGKIVLSGALLGIALSLRLDFTVREMLFGYITRSSATNSPKANDALLIYPIIGTFVGATLAITIAFLSRRHNRRRIANGEAPSDPIWIMLAVLVLSIASGAVYGHHFG